jgi:hypothetical protein
MSSSVINPTDISMKHRISPDSANRDMDSVDDFAARHGISRGYLYELWKRGEGPAYIQLGKRRFVTKDAGAAWRKSLEKTAKATKAAA